MSSPESFRTTDSALPAQPGAVEQLADSTSVIFTRVMHLAGQRAGHRGFRSRGWAVHRVAQELATKDEAAFSLGEISPRGQALLSAVVDLWENELSVEEKLALFVHGLWINPYAATAADVLHACNLAGPQFRQPVDELSRLEAGQVLPLGAGEWGAEVGNGAATVALGTYSSVGAAYEAAHSEIISRRARLRALMASGPAALRQLAAMEWQSPAVAGWEVVQQVTIDDQDLVSIEEIARRVGVGRTTVDKWIARHQAFPRGLNGTTARRWSAVTRWLHDTGRKPVAAANGGATSQHQVEPTTPAAGETV